ncbi:response regulator transcription factor [Mesobacillus subterraneus]|uniref:DNA-binding response regulator n=1 Tax=Mesobacillus subterraneus TaxID=285983 RepID=A0A3R9FKI1_9BACI|nr:response regulator transcription factor [Mesobacillus subterraneus]RSD28505.1 DNA-binding response regulator [Mesobacillus subterraneus]
MEMKRLLLVDDEEDLLIMLKMVIGKEGDYSIDTACTGRDALLKVKQNQYDFIVLDIMLPDMEGYRVCTEIRQIADTPILFLSAKNSDLDKLMGFAHGADDYLAKPFNPLEVAARIKAILRRTSFQKEERAEEVLDFGWFSIHLSSAELMVDGKAVPCTGILYQLLLLFCRNPNRVFSKEEIYERIWKESHFINDNTVMVHIRKLREKIEKDPSQPEFIRTVHGLGYKFVARD